MTERAVKKLVGVRIRATNDVEIEESMVENAIYLVPGTWYLFNRRAVMLKGELSNNVDMLLGVAQGCTL